jgi:hypothetical protein
MGVLPTVMPEPGQVVYLNTVRITHLDRAHGFSAVYCGCLRTLAHFNLICSQ